MLAMKGGGHQSSNLEHLVSRCRGWWLNERCRDEVCHIANSQILAGTQSHFLLGLTFEILYSVYCTLYLEIDVALLMKFRNFQIELHGLERSPP